MGKTKIDLLCKDGIPIETMKINHKTMQPKKGIIKSKALGLCDTGQGNYAKKIIINM